MVYLPTFTIKSTIHVGKYTAHGSYGLLVGNFFANLKTMSKLNLIMKPQVSGC